MSPRRVRLRQRFAWRATYRRLAYAAPIGVALCIFAACGYRLMLAAMATTSSDSLYLAGLYRDLVTDRVSLRGWQLQPAPSFFPDMPLFFFLRAATGNPVAAIGASAAVQVGVLGALTTWLLKILDVESRVAWTTSFLGIALLAYVASTGRYPATLFPVTIHFGSLLVGFASSVVVVRALRRGRLGMGSWVVLFALCAFTAASDRIYAVWCAVPLAATCLACIAARKINMRVGLLTCLALGAGLLAARQLEKLPNRFGLEVPSSDPILEYSWKRVLRILDLLPPPETPDKVVNLTTALFVVACLGTFSVVVVAARGFHDRPRVTFLSALVLSCFSCTFLGVAFSGAYWEAACARYLTPLLVVPYVVASVLLAVLGWKGRALMLALVAGVYGYSGGGGGAGADPAAAATYASLVYPPQSACVDDVARQYRAYVGYGDYWSARKLTELSRRGLRIAAVRDPFDEDPWIASGRCHRMARLASVFLVLPARLTAASVHDRLGEPTAIADCPDGPVWVYRR